ncbi:TonB-dependent receptor [Ideonella sp. TBM-1]|uniref:TonB-dependent receptor n=2 Tax=Ideonella livida TaxID=2707176 RepID=A0A7C9TJ30_9BURK|nr:TonB-dependent receptor [Ideonella livida]
MAMPYAVSVVDREALRLSGPGVNLSEAMARVPGLVVNNRANYAQDLQISARGFGARAGFGVRGVRLYADGIPASGPDGQGQVSHFNLGDAQRVEVLRGPFSVLYGNSSGGVINLISAPVDRAEAELALDAGSFGLRQARARVAGPLGQGWDARLSLSQFRWDGFREHSAAERTQAHLRLGWTGASDRVVLVAGYFDQPSDDPLGLKPADFAADPLQTVPEAEQYNTRKVARQTQLGLSWRHDFGEDGPLRESLLSAYSGQRGVTQWQAIPVGTQGNPRHGGGVVDFDRDYNGLEARLRWQLDTVALVTGLAWDRQVDDRRGYENFIGSTLGVTGALRREEDNTARSRDAYAQADWPLAADWTASAGVRSGRVRYVTEDHYVKPPNVDDSGALAYDYTNPVLGLRWQLDPGWQLHASVARGFEAPTLGELAYRPDGAGGFNTALKPQVSRQLEVGGKWRRHGWALDLTAFLNRVSDELATLTNSGGRSTFQNVGDTRRQGLELAGRWQLAPQWRAQTALTWLQAEYLDAFKACAGTPCTSPSLLVPAGNRIAGTQGRAAWAELAWQGGHWGEWAVEARGVGRVQANDANTASAAGHGLAALRWSQRYALSGAQRLEVLARVDNLADRRYAGSVIVNDGNGRYLETGSPRAVLLGLRWVGGL